MKASAWNAAEPAIRISDHIYMSRGVSNSYLVESGSGDVVINTGTPAQGPRHRERFEQLLGRPLAVEKIVLTESYTTFIGGYANFTALGAETFAQRNFPDGRLDWTLLQPFRGRRSARLFNVLLGIIDDHRSETLAILSDAGGRPWNTVEPGPLTMFDDSYTFEAGGRQFELYSVPGGETTDSLAVWLPEERTVFTGNLLGSLYGQLPHLYTLRGDRLRSARLFIRSVDRVLELEPELLIPGHGQPIEGTARIRADLIRIRDATQYIHDQTVKGMNEGKDLWTLMAEIRLPSDLEPVPQGRGRVGWYVRAVWEEYAGWFRFESTTELYPIPPRAIWQELTELVGGPGVLAERASARVRAGEPVEALHYTDIALSVDPGHIAARNAQIAALELLLERSGGDAWDEVRWLETEIGIARSELVKRSKTDRSSI